MPPAARRSRGPVDPPEQEAETAAHNARVQCDWEDSQQREAAAELERLEEKRQGWLQTRAERSQTYLPEQVEFGRVFTAPPGFLSEQLGG